MLNLFEVDPTRLELVTSAMRRQHLSREVRFGVKVGDKRARASTTFIFRLCVCPAKGRKDIAEEKEFEPSIPWVEVLRVLCSPLLLAVY